ncbi:hypothetical protein FPY71_12040 [Aureimonas fodinaquatilis]|uniref:Sel1 repeat family protein n=1 Tax=Aureimonas fodinaquatilis TaxID=2565783 RepID=A0A5B0E117_9HYPH|nr:SEL1-like repeat protein [Aureimonas fodinaquatilis]KAA0971159.1 hypothetical protein FPY71_12040 [Aureimonas fodinaquatilis]
MGVAERAKAGRSMAGASPSSVAALTRTLEELEQRLARLSSGKPTPKEKLTPSERLRQIVDSGHMRSGAMPRPEEHSPVSAAPTTAAMQEMSREIRALRAELRQEMAAEARIQEQAINSGFATLGAAMESREESELLADGLAEILNRISSLESGSLDESALDHLRREIDVISGFVQRYEETESLNTHRWDGVEAQLAEIRDVDERAFENLSLEMQRLSQRVDQLLAGHGADTLNRDEFNGGMESLAERLGAIEATLLGLPDVLGLSRLEERIGRLTESMDALDVLPVPQGSSSNVEERLDEISSAILALDSGADGFDSRAIEERLELLCRQIDSLAARGDERAVELGERIDRTAFPEAMLENRLTEFMQQLETADEERYQRHAAALTQELKRLEQLWQLSDERAGEIEVNLGAILKNVAERLAALELEAGSVRSKPGEGTVFDADFSKWTPDEDESNLAQPDLHDALEKHLSRRAADAGEKDVADTATATGQAEFGTLLERVRRHERASSGGPTTRADFIAAARRAAAAASAEADALHRGPFHRAGALSAHRKPVLMAASAIVLALLALPFGLEQLRKQDGSAQQIAGRELPQQAVPGVSMETTASIPAQTVKRGAETSADLLANLVLVLPASARGELPAFPAGATSALHDAARRGNLSAMHEIGIAARDSGNGAVALAWLGQAARRGYAPAQYELGILFEHGAGVARDAGAARSWYLLAARKGNVRAMYNLAVMEASGVAGPVDSMAAARWFKAAAERGMADSQFNLAILYSRGTGVEPSIGEAYRWFSIAAQSGDEAAVRQRAELAGQLPAARRAEIDLAVATWRPLTPLRTANDSAPINPGQS